MGKDSLSAARSTRSSVSVNVNLDAFTPEPRASSRADMVVCCQVGDWEGKSLLSHGGCREGQQKTTRATGIECELFRPTPTAPSKSRPR